MSSARESLTSLAVFGILAVWSCLLMPIGWLIWLGHRLTESPVFHRLARRAGWLYGRSSLLLLRPFIRVWSINPGAALGHGPCIITVNHQSIFDLYLLGFQSRTDVCTVTKSWPFKRLLPFTALMRTAGYIEAEGREPEEVLRECRARLAEGCSLVVYPEGHRSRDGTLGRFHVGAFLMALEADVPIVPMVIKNSHDILPPGSFRVRCGTLEMEMLPAILPSEYARFRAEPLPHRALLKHVRQLYVERLAPFRN